MIPKCKRKMVYVDDILDLFHPVGSYYETSVADFDPNVEWGRYMGGRYKRFNSCFSI